MIQIQRKGVAGGRNQRLLQWLEREGRRQDLTGGIDGEGIGISISRTRRFWRLMRIRRWGLSTALGVDVEITIDDIRKEVVATAEDGDTKTAVELSGEARYRDWTDALVEQDGYSLYRDGQTGREQDVTCKISTYLKEVIRILS